MKTNINASSLWDSIKTYAMKAGRVAAKPVLHLYFVMTDDETPRSTKLLIGSALAYIVLPINLVSSKKHPGIGWIDEAASIAIVYQKVKKSITTKIEQETEEVLNKWFGEGAPKSPTAGG